MRTITKQTKSFLIIIIYSYIQPIHTRVPIWDVCHFIKFISLKMLNNSKGGIKKMSERQTLAGNLANLLTWSLANLHSLIHSLWTCWTTFVFMSMLKTYSHTFSLSHFLTLTLSRYLIDLLWKNDEHRGQENLFVSFQQHLAIFVRPID